MPLNPKLKKKKTEEEKERAYTKQTNNVSLPTKKTYTPVMTEAKRAAQEIRNTVGEKTVNRHTDDKYGNAERGYSVSKKETPKETKKPYASSYKGVNRESLSQHRKEGRSFNEAQRDEQLWGLSSTAGGKLISNFYDSALDNSPIGAVATLATGERPSNYFNQNNPYNDIRTEGAAAGIGRMAGMAANYGMLRTAFNPQLDKAATAVMNGTKLGDAIKGSGVLGKIGQTVGRGTASDIAQGLIRETISDATIGAGTNAIINYGEGLRGSDFWKQQAKDTALDFLIGGAMEGVGIGKQIGRASGKAKALAGENVVNMLANSETKRDYINNLIARHNELLANTSGETARALRNASTAKAAEYKDEFGKIINMTDEEFDAYRKSKLPSSAGEPKAKPVEETKVKEPIQEEPVAEEPIDEELDIEPELEGVSRYGGFNRPTKGYASAKGRYDAYTGRKKPTETAENATVKASENVDTAGKLAPQEEMKLEPEKPVKETTTKKKSNKGKKKADQQAEMMLEQKPKEEVKKTNKASVSKAANEMGWEDFETALRNDKDLIADAKANKVDPKKLREYWVGERDKGFTKADIKELPKEDAVKTVRENMDEDTLSGWFRNADSGYKPKIEATIYGNKELRNAGLNIAYHNYKDSVGKGKAMSFEEFLNTPMKMYRGTKGKGTVADDVFASFTTNRKIAEKFAGPKGSVEEITIKPADTLGGYQTTGEFEYIIPTSKKPKGIETKVEQPKAEPVKEQPKAEEPKTKTQAKGKPDTRTPSDRMAYKTLINMPDSEEKFLALEKKIGRDNDRLNSHGEHGSYISDMDGYKKAEPEYLRLRNVYGKTEPVKEQPKAGTPVKEEVKATERKPHLNMSYSTLISLPDSEAKFLTLERKLMKLQPHGSAFEEGQKEWRRLFETYRGKGAKETATEAATKAGLPKAEVKPKGDLPKAEIVSHRVEASDALNELENKGWVFLGKNGSIKKGADGAYTLKSADKTETVLTKEQAEKYVKDTVEEFNANLKVNKDLPKKADLDAKPQVEVEAKPEAKAEAKPEGTYANVRAQVHGNLKKQEILDEMHNAGVNLPEGAEKWTKQELLDYNNGKKAAEDISKKYELQPKRQSKKKQIDLFEYDDIVTDGYRDSKADEVIKDELLKKYKEDYEKLGTPLDNERMAELEKLNIDELQKQIQEDGLARAGAKNVDEYIDNRVYRKENSQPELVSKADRESEVLKSEQLRKGRDDAYTREKGEIDPYTGREIQKQKTTPDEVAQKIDGFLKPRFEEGIYPVPSVMAKRLEIPEEDIRKFIEESDDYVLDGKNIKPKSAATTVTSAEGEATQTMAGYATTYGTGNKRNKGLPTKLTKEKAENIKTKRFAAMDNADELTKSNKKKPKKIELDASKVDDIKLDAGEARTSIETGTPKEKTLKERTKSLWKKFRRDILDSTDEFRAMDNATGKTKLQEKYKMSQGSRAQAGHQLVTEITDRKGNALKFKDKDGNDVTKSFREVFKDFEDHMDDVSLYMFNKHEIQRAMQSNKNALSLSIYGYSKDEAAKAANAVVNAYPELKKQKDAIEDWLANGMQNDDAYRAIKGKVDGFDNVIQKLNQIKSEQAQKTVEALEAKYGKEKLEKLSKDWKETYERWFDEWAVKSGLVDKNLTKEWRGKYSNYIPSFRVQDVTSGPMKILDSPDVFHSIKGKTDAKLLSVEDQVGIMINRVTSAARRNELNLSILRAIQENPNKGWGKVISVEDDLIGDIDNALKIVAGSAGDIINGSKKLSVLADGKKITMEISDELAATLRAMQDGADTGIMTRLGKALTNPIKLGITGANPTFVVSNAVRDMATALIQSEHGMGKTITGWTKALRGMTGTNKEYAELLKRYKFAGGEMAGYYVQGKGFDTSAILQQKGIKGVLNKVGQVITFLGEQGETIPRFGEFINTMEKTGDFYKAVRDAAEVTVDFSKHGASDGAKLLDAWTLYLNAGLQGIDKFAKTLKAHPLRTAGRTAATILTPALPLMAINHDNPWYWELSDRTRQNYFCIPRLDGEVDEDGNCKEFIRLPMNREYGAILGAGIDAIWRGIKGEENVTSGFAETLKENFLPNNPITDNVLAPMLINIPSNQDYKGAKILTSSEFDDFKAGKNADLQYDAKTSGTAMRVAELANSVMGDKNIPILKYLKSPKLVDYMLDSYGGYYGQIAQSATEQGVDSAGKIAENILLKPYANKFTADPRYSSQTMDEAWDKIAEYKSDQKRAADEGKEWSEAHAKYNAVSKVMKSIYDSYDAEKEVKNDPTLSEQEKKKLVNELREARLELAKTMDSEAEAAAKEYKESPTYSALNEKVKEKYSYTLKISKENWAKAYKAKSDISDAKEEKTGKGTTAEENRIILLDNGIKTYEQAQSLLGKDTSKEAWEYAVEQHEAGVSYRDLVKEAKNYPNYYALDYKQKQKWNEDIGVDKETWGKAYQAKLEANREKQAKVGRDLTAEEEMILLKDHGIKTLEQAQTIDAGIGKSVMLYGDPEAAWDDMVKAVKSGRTYEEAKADAEADAIKYNNAKERVSTMDIPNKHQSKAASIMVKYDGKTVSQKAYDLYTKMVFVANDNNPDKTKRNDTLDTQEIKSAIEEVNKRYGLTQAQKAYIFANTAPKNWNNPYD